MDRSPGPSDVGAATLHLLLLRNPSTDTSVTKLIAAALAFCAVSAPAFADALNFVPGRPGNTDSPISVPAGRIQIESELAGFSRAGGGEQAWDALNTDIRYGLAPNWDAEAIIAPFNQVDGGGETEEGFGDTTLRLRHTFTGQDGNGPAFAVIGFVTLPTATNHMGDGAVEGGAEITGTFSLTQKTGLTYTAGAAEVSDNGDYKPDVFGGVNVSHQLTDKLGVFGEVFAHHSEGATAATLDVGAAYLCGPRTQWDVGANIGVNHAADDLHLFIGWAHLF